MGECSISLAMRKMQIKLLWHSRSPQSEWLSSRKTNEKMLARKKMMKKNIYTLYTADGNVNLCSHYGKQCGGFPTPWHSCTTPGHIPKLPYTYYRDICPSMFSDIHNSKGMESAYIPTSTWMNNENAVHKHNEVLSHKKVKPWQLQENGCNWRSLY